jgi:hypothetical protein
LVFLVQILIQLVGHPYEARQIKLQILDVTSIIVCWCTMWSGFFFLGVKKEWDKKLLVLLTIVVLIINVVHMIVLVGSMIVEMCNEKKKTSPMMKKIIKRTSSMVPLRIQKYRQRKSKRLTSGGEVELTSFENPMQTNGVKNEIKKKKRNSRMKKVRKKLSIGARVKRISHMAGHGGFMGGEVKTVAEVETAVTIHVDEDTGRRYSYDAAADQTQWLEGDDETTTIQKEDDEEAEGETKQHNIKKRPLFRQFMSDEDEVFYENVETGEAVWKIPDDGDLVES